MFSSVAQFAFDGLEHSLHCFAARKSGRLDKLTPRIITLSTVLGLLVRKAHPQVQCVKMVLGIAVFTCGNAYHEKTRHHVRTYRHESINHHTTHENTPNYMMHTTNSFTRTEGDGITQTISPHKNQTHVNVSTSM